MCPACLAAIVLASATSGGGVWALKRITQKENGMKEESTAVPHQVVTREEWLAARLKLLQEEKEHTRRADEMAQQRQGLAWVRVEEGDRFDTHDGRALFFGLFRRLVPL